MSVSRNKYTITLSTIKYISTVLKTFICLLSVLYQFIYVIHDNDSIRQI